MSCNVTTSATFRTMNKDPKTLTETIHRSLTRKNLTLAVAESCTGGLLSKLLTDHAGSSRYFLLGVVAYSNDAKEKSLNIPASSIKKHGAVSKEVACLMARMARRITRSNLAIGITGIAGPSGGTPDKPVGTVFIGTCGGRACTCRKFRFRGTRDAIRKAACLKALEMLKSIL